MRSIFLASLVALVCAAVPFRMDANQDEAASGHAEFLTPQDALSRVMESNPELKAFELEIAAASARERQAAARPNPDLSAEAQNLPSLSLGNLLETTEADVSISQRLETGGKRRLRMQAAGKEKIVADGALALSRTELINSTMQAFADVLSNQERLVNGRDLRQLAQKLHSVVVDRVTAGKSSPVEVTRSSVALAAAQLEEQKLAKEWIASKDRLAALWGGSSDDFSRAAAEFAIPALPPNIDACIETGPDLKLAGATVEARQAALLLEKSMRTPDVTITGGFRRSNLDILNAWVAGISIPLPMFDKREGAIAEARIRLDKASYEKLALERVLRGRLTQARHNYNIALLEANALAETAMPSAKEAFTSVEEGYRLGKFEYVNVLDSQRIYAELQRKHIDAVAAGLKAAVEISRLSGCEPIALHSKGISYEK